jgi:hypothetical protein
MKFEGIASSPPSGGDEAIPYSHAQLKLYSIPLLHSTFVINFIVLLLSHLKVLK